MLKFKPFKLLFFYYIFVRNSNIIIHIIIKLSSKLIKLKISRKKNMNQNQNIIQKEESNLNRPDQYMQESDTEKEEPLNLLILPYSKKYAYIDDINREIKSIKMKILLSNPLLLKVLAVHENKIELRFNETLYLNQTNDTEIKLAKTWTSDSI